MNTDLPFSYPEVGAVLRGKFPLGYEHFGYGGALGEPEHFPVAVDDLLSWRMHERAGIRVRASAPRAAPGVVLVQRLWVGLVAPVRVIDVVTEPDRVTLVYGTLRGHPECGEERFVVERGEITTLPISGFVRPDAWYARLGGPVTRLVQRRITERYLRALQEP